MRSWLIAAVVLLCWPAAAAAQSPASAAPRETVRQVAATVRDLYFDAGKGEEIAAALEAEAAAGRYDALTDPRDLAASLTQRLKTQDAHFQVTFAANGGAGPAAVSAAPRGGATSRSPQDIARRNNFGFRQVTVFPGNIGYLQLRSIANIDFDNPDDPARAAADAALALTSHSDAMIIDLRENSGGAPSMVGYLVSAFTEPGANVFNSFRSRHGVQQQAPRSPYPTPRPEVPLYVLISGRTGSAAEGLAYTLQAAGRAVVVGQASAGGANPGGQVPIGGGFMLFVSTGSPINPITGANWEGTGVIPDVAVAPRDALTRAQILALERSVADGAGRDAEWALESLKATATNGSDLADFVGQYGPVAIAVDPESGRLVSRRRPGLDTVLRPIATNVFEVEGDPAFRFVFERDQAGRVISLEQRAVQGGSQRLLRTD